MTNVRLRARRNTASRGRDDADLALRRAKTKLMEHELRRHPGEFVDQERVTDMLVARATVLRKALRAAGRRLAPRLAGVTDPVEIQAANHEEDDRIFWLCYGRSADGALGLPAAPSRARPSKEGNG